MTCFMCHDWPRKLRQWADYGTVAMAQKSDRESGTYTLCPRCYERVKAMIWRRDTEDEMRAVRAEDQAGGAEGGHLAEAGRDDHGAGAGMGDAGMPQMRGEDTGLYLQEG